MRREADEDKAYHIELQNFYRLGDRSVNPPVLPGDVIVVSGRASSTSKP